MLFLCSCEQQSSNSKPIEFDEYTVRMIGDCEYIEYEYGFKGGAGYSYSITHKGDCKNSIHKCKCDGKNN